jgi:NTE family protein
MVDVMPKVAIACQGGGTHAAFEVGVLTEILKDIQERNRFELTGLSGTSAGAL